MMMPIQLPYNFIARDYQEEFIASPHRFKIAVWHRRGGKSKTAVAIQAAKAIIRKGIYYTFLPTYRQAKQVAFDELVKKHVPMEYVSKFNESELSIYYKNGSIQRFAGTEDWEKHKGINPIDVIFDEFQLQDEKVWTELIYPILKENGGTATFIGTPAGKNHFWRLVEKAKEDKRWFVSIKGVYDTKGLTPEEIEEARTDMPESLFAQEFLCAFVEQAGSVFRRVRQNTYNAIEVIYPDHFYQIGVDLAMYNDWTVITIIDLNTFKVLPQIRFNQVDWNLQKARIEATALRFNNANIIIDSTGQGDPIVRELIDRGLNIDEDEGVVKFNERNRKQLIENLSILLEQDKIKIPNDNGLINELESMQFKMTKSGKIRADVPDGMHDDRIFSLILACKNLKEPLTNFNNVKTISSQSTSNIHDPI